MVLGVWSIFAFIIKCIFPCSFGYKRMRLLTRVYGMSNSHIKDVFFTANHPRICINTTIHLRTSISTYSIHASAFQSSNLIGWVRVYEGLARVNLQCC